MWLTCAQGRVTVNGAVSRSGNERVDHLSDVRVDGRRVAFPHPLRHRSPDHPPVTILYNKRAGELVTRVGPTIQRSIHERFEEDFPTVHPYLTPVVRTCATMCLYYVLVSCASMCFYGTAMCFYEMAVNILINDACLISAHGLLPRLHSL